MQNTMVGGLGGGGGWLVSMSAGENISNEDLVFNAFNAQHFY